MEEDQEEEEEEQVSDEKGTGAWNMGSMASSFLWRGLRLGKKAAIAGAAIASAPAVIPPLIVGLACAFPFGLYLAGYAYTDKVMSALLSPPPPLFVDRDDNEEGGDEANGQAKIVGDHEVWPTTTTNIDVMINGDNYAKSEEEMKQLADDDEEKATIGPATVRLIENQVLEIETACEDEEKVNIRPPTVHQSENQVLQIETESGLEEAEERIATGEEGKAEDGQGERAAQLVQVQSSGGRETVVALEDAGAEKSAAEDPRGLVEGREAKKERASAEKGQAEEERGEPAIVTATAKDKIHMRPLTSSVDFPWEEGDNMEGREIGEERHVEEVRGTELDNHDTEQEIKIKSSGAFSVNVKEDISRDVGTLKEERPIQVEREEENEERGETKEKEIPKEKINEEQEIGSSDLPPAVDEYMQRGSFDTEGGEKPVEVTGNVEMEKAVEEVKEIQGLATDVSEAKQYPKSSYTFAAVIPKDGVNGTQQTILSSKCASSDEKGNKIAAKEVKQPQIELEERTEGIGHKIQDAPPTTLEAQGLLPTCHCSLTAVPEEHEMDFKIPSISSEHELSGAGEIKGASTGTVEANKVKVKEQEGMEMTQDNYVVTTLVSVEQSALAQTRDGRGVETLGPEATSRKEEGGVMGEGIAENGSSTATPDHEECLMTVYHSLFSVALSEHETDMAPSILSTEYASASDDRSSDMTDAKIGAAAIAVESTVAGVVHSEDEVFYSEEMIWEQIYAMRTIVGYRAALQYSLIDELKALYLFTGVEPPVSLNEASDVMEIGKKLDFLKSVIGVK